MNRIKELFNKIYFWILDFSCLSTEELISVLSNKTNMFKMAKELIYGDKISEREYYEEVIDGLRFNGLVNYSWRISGVQKGKFLKMIKEQKEMFFERIKINHRMEVLEELELKGLSEEEVHLIKKGSSWNIDYNEALLTPEKEEELSKKYECFRLRRQRDELDRKIILSFKVEGDGQ